jgi:hypothetical protein
LKSKYKFLINGDDYLKLTDKERNKAIWIPYEYYKKFVFITKSSKIETCFEFLNTNCQMLINLLGEGILINLECQFS